MFVSIFCNTIEWSLSYPTYYSLAIQLGPMFVIHTVSSSLLSTLFGTNCRLNHWHMQSSLSLSFLFVTILCESKDWCIASVYALILFPIQSSFWSLSLSYYYRCHNHLPRQRRRFLRNTIPFRVSSYITFL